MNSRWVLFFQASLAVAASGCVVGNGIEATETRDVASFNAVSNSSPIDVFVQQGSTFSVQVRGDSNLLPLVETRVVGSDLRITVTQAVNFVAPSEVDITMPTLTSLQSSGSGQLSVSGFMQQAEVDVISAGSGDVTLANGSTTSLSVTNSGSGDIHAQGFATTSASVRLAGSGNVSVTIDGDATLQTAGSGDIFATLNHATVQFSIVGSGDIDWTGTATVQSTTDVGSGNVNHTS